MQQAIIETAVQALCDAQREQWEMIEEELPVLAAEYLITTAVARALAKEIAPGLVKVERLIRHAFRNTMMFRHLLDKDPPYFYVLTRPGSVAYRGFYGVRK